MRHARGPFVRHREKGTGTDRVFLGPHTAWPLLSDDLPLGNFVGVSEGGSEGTNDKRVYYLYNTFDFAIEFNEDNVRSGSSERDTTVAGVLMRVCLSCLFFFWGGGAVAVAGADCAGQPHQHRLSRRVH